MNLARCVALLLTLGIPWPVAHADEPRYEWRNVTHKAAFAPRDGAGTLTFQDRTWLIGGWNPGDKLWIIGGDVNQKHYQNDVWKLVR